MLKFILDVNSHIAISHSPGEDILSSVSRNLLYSYFHEVLSVMRQRVNKNITEYFSCRDFSLTSTLRTLQPPSQYVVLLCFIQAGLKEVNVLYACVSTEMQEIKIREKCD